MKYLLSIGSSFLVSLLVMTIFISYAHADDLNIKLGAPFQLGLDQTATGQEGLKIKFANLTEDSRCPSDVTCIWQGQATILVNVEKNGQNFGNFSLSTLNDKKAVQTFDHYFIRLINVDPYPISGNKTQLPDYVVTLKLSLFPPLKQLKSGIPIGELTCMQGFSLVIKSEDNFPACVKPETAAKLVARGWTPSIVAITQPDSEPGQNQIVTLEQNGQTINLHKGQNFLLKLGKDFEWNIAIDNQTVVSRVPNIMVVVGAQGIFTAHNIGETKLSAVGDPWCLKETIPCKIHSILFESKIVVS